MSASQETVPIQVKGIDPALEPQVTDMKQAMLSGDLEALNEPGHGGLDGIVLGKDLAAKLSVEIGDEVTLLTPQGTLSPMGMMPRPRRLRVVGTFSLGSARIRFDVRVRVARRGASVCSTRIRWITFSCASTTSDCGAPDC